MTTPGIDSFRDGLSSKFLKIVDRRFTFEKTRQRSSRQKRCQAAFNQESNNINTRYNKYSANVRKCRPNGRQ